MKYPKTQQLTKSELLQDNWIVVKLWNVGVVESLIKGSLKFNERQINNNFKNAKTRKKKVWKKVVQ